MKLSPRPSSFVTPSGLAADDELDGEGATKYPRQRPVADRLTLLLHRAAVALSIVIDCVETADACAVVLVFCL